MQNQVAELPATRSTGQAVAACWQIITSEYPPQSGGVSDYTHRVAAGLAAQGDEVHVWAPACPGGRTPTESVLLHRELGAITPADLRRVGQQLDRFPAPRKILVQWVPHGYGYRSMNLAFCWWLRNRAVLRRDTVEIMLHEPYLDFWGGSPQQTAAALVHRLMSMVLLRAARRVWISIPAWERRWRPYALGRRVPFQWLPIPSNIPVANNPGGVEAVRNRYAAAGSLIGHFGTYGRPITSLLEPILCALGNDPVNQTILLMGIGSERFRDSLIGKDPRLHGLIHAVGALAPEDVSCHIAACDVMIQPYPDGVSSRRTSFMAGLSHGKPVVTTTGPWTEEFWAGTGAAPMAQAGDITGFVELVRRFRDDPKERALAGAAARNLYEERFDLRHVIANLRSTSAESKAAEGGERP